MQSFLALVKKDLKGYFDQPTGYILLVIFVGVVSYLFFRTVQNTAEASLRPLFATLPWILTVFVAASTMRLLSEEQRDGTLETLVTQPIRWWQVIASKFVAGLVFVSVGVLATILIPLTIRIGGDLDEGAILAQYIGALFLISAFVSIGVFASSLTRNQIVAFMIGLAITIGLMLAGLEVVTLAVPPSVAPLVQDLSPLTHFNGILRGVLDLSDILYFVALVAVFMSGAYLMVRGKSLSHRSPFYRNLRLGVAGLVILALLVGWFGRSLDFRLDLTEEKLYTLSPATEELLSDLDDIVTIKFFASKDPPVQVALTTREVNDTLNDIEAISNGNVKVFRRFPEDNEEHTQEANENFVPPVQFSDQSGGDLRITLGYLGLSMQYANELEVIQFIDSVETLEFQIVSNIFKMAQEERTTIGFLAGQGERADTQEMVVLRQELSKFHDVRQVRPVERTGILDLRGIDVLVVAAGTEEVDIFTQASIDDYLSRAGKAIFLVDGVVIDQQALRGASNEFSKAGFLTKYGVQVNNDVVFDLRASETINFATQFGSVPIRYPYWVRAQTTDRQISGGITSVMLPWSSSIEVIEPTSDTQVEVTTLLSTTENGGRDTIFQDLSPDSGRLSTVTESELGEIPLAVAITGTRCSPANPSCTPDPADAFRIIVVSDAEWISNSMTGQFPEHVPLAVNWIDWLSAQNDLTTIRAKGAAIRSLLFDSEAQFNAVQYANIAGLPLFFVLLGVVRFLLRRNTTRRVYSRE